MHVSAAIQLNEQQSAQIEEMQTVCRTHDDMPLSLLFNNDMNYYVDMDCYYLLHENNKLIGALSVFAPMRDIVELSAYVLPKFRRQGGFKMLVAAACWVLAAWDIRNVLFVHPANGAGGGRIAEKWALPLSHSEYLMRFDARRYSMSADNTGIAVRQSHVGELEQVIRLSGAIFDNTPEDARNIVEESFANEKYLCFNAYLNNKLIGLCNVGISGQELSVFGLGIAPEEQGRGYGRALLNAVIRTLLNEYSGKGITLEVDRSNARAFNLYTSSGFTIETQYDYYAAETETLMKAAKSNMSL